MGGLGNLKRNDKRKNQQEKELSKIQIGTSFKSKDTSNAIFKRYTFSLTTEISENIDRLTLRSKTRRISRSDIIKLGLYSLNSLNDKDFDRIITQLK
ncbi:hypothetical protein BPLS_P4517 [Bathymodiolus platifrons methanotrophic gill symbiont]|uniref:hypothetical protein n=1 Tax=Bathymodiolus platifrons methanotrophic gill symbiont TaxID=113268 RepID=UPI000B419EC8|nr:hypothetical protein [Bathymodiolus platifrons methanotrophic gill symbiont]TXL02244.1 hypothetical protein BMR08_18650 [Methylococcaceae bacterium CS2]TXL03226.1 hypothetical protein BMR09_15320 [Methylococcaceae bacterium CS3]TXL12481.1 hypothetical protein BMR04_15470 [Methylococcaceae bacterium HT3]GFO76618.1 hypothetical protein BPLS_P4517 [Bathymodiolus platifrons methanotrophic gill symbiont]